MNITNIVDVPQERHFTSWGTLRYGDAPPSGARPVGLYGCSRTDTFDCAANVNRERIVYCAKSSREDVNASTCIALKNESYIVIATDSRSRITRDGAVVSLTDTFEKIVFLPEANVAFVAVGVNIVNGMPICDFVRGLDIPAAEQLTTTAGRIVREIRRYVPDGRYVNACIARGREGFVCDIGANAPVLRAP